MDLLGIIYYFTTFIILNIILEELNNKNVIEKRWKFVVKRNHKLINVIFHKQEPHF